MQSTLDELLNGKEDKKKSGSLAPSISTLTITEIGQPIRIAIVVGQ